MIEPIERMGKLIHECSLPGETRADGVFPGHINGALIHGKPVPHASVFAAHWWIMGVTEEKTAAGRRHAKDWNTMDTEWLQFRLNDCENDIEIIQPAGLLRQNGRDDRGGVRNRCSSYVQAVPFNEDATEWAGARIISRSPLRPSRCASSDSIQRPAFTNGSKPARSA
jgi:hypothetical protein